MILQRELREIAEKLQLPGNTIDKDFVLGDFSMASLVKSGLRTTVFLMAELV